MLPTPAWSHESTHDCQRTTVATQSTTTHESQTVKMFTSVVSGKNMDTSCGTNCLMTSEEREDLMMDCANADCWSDVDLSPANDTMRAFFWFCCGACDLYSGISTIDFSCCDEVDRRRSKERRTSDCSREGTQE